ncbi:MAG: D-alanine--D-alanine ligase, partial [Candidatus Pacebacteria bacterium]|nr:D-alanine--D-alanine ligase [Candidatus Paceibacterota bacterium]
IGLFFGGKSVEHDVSVVSAKIINKGFEKLKSEFKVIPIYITPTGEWIVFKNFPSFRELKEKRGIKSNIRILFNPSSEKLILRKKFVFGKKIIIDVAFPLVHGNNCEDGTLQGFFETTNVPLVGPSVLGSAIGMDKVITKDICRANDLPVVNYFWFYREEWEKNAEKIKNKIMEKIPFPVFIKPANLGSSIGITKAEDERTLNDAIEVAVRYSRKIIAEEGVKEVREINCAVVGFKEKETSLLEEPVHYSKFLTFEEKYIGEGKKGGGTMAGGKTKVKIPAVVDEKTEDKIKNISKKIFGLLECSGVSRVDFLLDPSGGVFINEINTIPGSLQQHLWQASGLELPELLKKIISLAEDSFIEKKKNLTRFESALLR